MGPQTFVGRSVFLREGLKIMSASFDITHSELPDEIPVFPLPRVILLPRVNLPLNIFEPRYLLMTEHALQNGRLIGMIQHAEGDALQKTGCVGRISSFTETDDGRFLVTLRGICRFDVARELPLAAGGFRRVQPDWSPYAGDFAPDTSTDVCRDKMMAALKPYLQKMDMVCDEWEKIRNIGCDSLISTLSVVCPFGTVEKQALLEAKTLVDRAKLLQAFLDIECKAAEEKEEDTCH
jgi:Lon protease-like protein